MDESVQREKINAAIVELREALSIHAVVQHLTSAMRVGERAAELVAVLPAEGWPSLMTGAQVEAAMSRGEKVEALCTDGLGGTEWRGRRCEPSWWRYQFDPMFVIARIADPAAASCDPTAPALPAGVHRLDDGRLVAEPMTSGLKGWTCLLEEDDESFVVETDNPISANWRCVVEPPKPSTRKVRAADLRDGMVLARTGERVARVGGVGLSIWFDQFPGAGPVFHAIDQEVEVLDTETGAPKIAGCPNCGVDWKRTEILGEARHGGGYRLQCHSCDHEWDDPKASHGERETARRAAGLRSNG